MPFPSTLEELEVNGYKFLRHGPCTECGELTDTFSTPGGREIVLEPMGLALSAAVRHLTTCKPKESNGKAPAKENVVSQQAGKREASTEEGNPAPKVVDIRMYGVTDPNHQLLAVGYCGGILAVQFARGKGEHTGVPEALYQELRRVPFAYKTYQTKLKGKFPYRKIE
jgi:hypothetical protein